MTRPALSRRTSWSRDRSPWARCLARQPPRYDLAVTNPTQAGLRHPPQVYAALDDPRQATYAPVSLGLPSAREAVAHDIEARTGTRVDPGRVWLTAGTSDGYAQLLSIVCDPGDAVLVPRPGYPLLDMLSDLASVQRVGYPVAYDGRWHVDLGGLARALDATPRARAIVLVAPGNPTGNYLEADEWEAVQRQAHARGLVLVVDEVFAAYPLRAPAAGETRVDCVLGRCRVPTFVLGGLSKLAALPQMKLSWVVADGTGDAEASVVVDEVLARAELVADAFLSVNTAVQLAAPQLLAAGSALRPAIVRRLHDNLAHLQRALAGTAAEVLDVAGGWTALLRLPQLPDRRDDEAWASALLDAGVATQPGFLFDLPPVPPRVGVSLLTKPATFAAGVMRLRATVRDATAGA